MSAYARLLSWLTLGLAVTATAYKVQVSDADYSRQTCSGMWADESTHIDGTSALRHAPRNTQVHASVTQVTFDATSQGQLSMVIYEWADVEYLGKITSYIDDTLPVSRTAVMLIQIRLKRAEPAENIRLHLRRSAWGILHTVPARPLHLGPSLWQVDQ